MFKIEGLDKLQKEIKQAEKAFKELDGELGHVEFNPHDPASISGAIASMEKMVDEKVGHYSRNELVAPMIDAAKEQLREMVLEKASRARLEADDE